MSPEAPGTAYCSECGRAATADELARFGDRLICPYCKDAYAQKLREGVAPAGRALHYAGFWIRVVASILDSIILGIVQWILNLAVLAPFIRMPRITPGEVPPDAFVGGLVASMGTLWLVGMAIGCTYETFFLVKFGATPGKMALGLKVIRADGGPIGVGRAVGRYFAKMLSAIILLIGYIMAGFDSQKRALHDYICDTRVVRVRL
jgi:uncharacterized RDD family membrane protein YckC